MPPIADLSPGVPELSPEASAARRSATARGRPGGYTGRELVEVAASIFEDSKRLRKLYERRGRQAVLDRSVKALLTAATQIRVAAMTPPAKGYLHALRVSQIDAAKREVAELYERCLQADGHAGALAVDTHRRIAEQRQRLRIEVAR